MSRPAKLSAADVERVRELHAGGESLKCIAARFEVSDVTVFNAVHRVGAYAPPRTYPTDHGFAMRLPRGES